MSHVYIALLLIVIVYCDIDDHNNVNNTTLPASSAETLSGLTTSDGNTSQGRYAATCSQQCSQQDISYCTGYTYPIEEDLGLSISCNTRDQHGRDRGVLDYIDSAIAGHWNNLTVVFQELLKRINPISEMFPAQYFTPDTAVISVLEGHKMSNSCNSDYPPLKEMLCSWVFVSPCQPHFKICQESCTALMGECFSSAMRDYQARYVLDFICGVMSRNNTDCYLPEDVYREDFNSRRESGSKSRSDYITILSGTAGAIVLLVGISFLFLGVRYYLKLQGFIEDDVTKFDMFDPACEKARQLLCKTDLFPRLRNTSNIERHMSLKKRATLKQEHILMERCKMMSDTSLDNSDHFDAFSINSSASTFYCQTEHSVSTIGEVLPPETIYFEGVLSSRWKTSEDEVIALVSWIDGIGNKKKGVIKCYTDKHQSQMVNELNLISGLSHDNICEYMWRSLGNRPLVRGMSPHLQSVMSVRNNYFCTEYYTYGSLKDFLTSRGHFLKDTVAQSFLRDIVSGMAYLHDLEVFHRDLKTANILVGGRSGKAGGCPFKLVVSDFGHSQERCRQDCYVRDGSGGTSQYTAPEVLLSNGSDVINLYKADVFSMALVTWELLSYVCCRYNEPSQRAQKTIARGEEPSPISLRCRIQNHTSFGDFLMTKFPHLTSTSTSSSVVRDYMRTMYKKDRNIRPSLPDRWGSVSPITKSMIALTRKMWHTEPACRISTAQLCRVFNIPLPTFNSRLSLNSTTRSTSKSALSTVLCTNSVPT